MKFDCINLEGESYSYNPDDGGPIPSPVWICDGIQMRTGSSLVALIGIIESVGEKIITVYGYNAEEQIDAEDGRSFRSYPDTNSIIESFKKQAIRINASHPNEILTIITLNPWRFFGEQEKLKWVNHLFEKEIFYCGYPMLENIKKDIEVEWASDQTCFVGKVYRRGSVEVENG